MTDGEPNDENAEEPADWEYRTYFSGECTCGHEMQDHGWGHCGWEGCECQAGWEY
jgi:hypothetical protein